MDYKKMELLLSNSQAGRLLLNDLTMAFEMGKMEGASELRRKHPPKSIVVDGCGVGPGGEISYVPGCNKWCGKMECFGGLVRKGDKTGQQSCFAKVFPPFTIVEEKY